MRRFLKWLLISLILAISAFVIFLLSFDVESYRGKIQSKATEILGHQVVIEGEISLKPSLIPTISLQDIKVKNSPWASQPHLAEIGLFELTFDLMALLDDEFIITYLSIDRMNLQLEISPEGKSNWQVEPQTKSGLQKVMPDISEVAIEHSILGLITKDGTHYQLNIDDALIEEKQQSMVIDMLLHYRERPLEVQAKTFTLKRLLNTTKWPFTLSVNESGKQSLQFNGQLEKDIHITGDAVLTSEDIEELNLQLGFGLPVRGAGRLSTKIIINGDDLVLDQINISGNTNYHGHPFQISTGKLSFIFGNQWNMELNGNLDQLPFSVVAKGVKEEEQVNWSEWPFEVLFQTQKNKLSMSGQLADRSTGQFTDITIALSGNDLSEFSFLYDQLPADSAPYEINTILSGEKGEYYLKKITASYNAVPFEGDLRLLLKENTWPRVVANLNSKKLDLKRLLDKQDLGFINTITSGPVKIHADLQGNNIQQMLSHGELSLDAKKLILNTSTELGQDLQLDSVKLSSINGQPLQVSLQAGIGGASIKSNIELDSLSNRLDNKTPIPLKIDAVIPGVALRAKGTVQTLDKSSGLMLDFNLSGKKLKSLESILDTKLPAAGPFHLAAKFTGKPGNYRFSNIKGKLGRTDLDGSLDVTTYKNTDRPVTLAARLKSNNLYLDDFLGNVKGSAHTIQAEKHLPTTKLPVKLMQSRDISLSLVADKVEVGGVVYKNLNTDIVIGNGQLSIKPLRAVLSGGEIQASLESMLAGKQASSSLKLEGKDIDYGELLASLDWTEDVTGMADVSIDLSGTGLDTAAILSSADGHVRIVSGKGTIDQTEIDLWAEGLFSIALTKTLKPVKQAEVNCMLGFLDFEQGKVTTDSLLLDTRRLTVAGSGSLDLATEELNLLLTPKPKNPRLVSLAKPVRLVGNFKKPKVKLDKEKEVWMLGGLLAGLANPATLILFYGDMGAMGQNPCEEALKKRELEEQKADLEKQQGKKRLPGGRLLDFINPFD